MCAIDLDDLVVSHSHPLLPRKESVGHSFLHCQRAVHCGSLLQPEYVEAH